MCIIHCNAELQLHTHVLFFCAVCDSMCEGGQGACIQVGGSLPCCKYYDSVTKMCTNNCPADLEAANFTCGKCYYCQPLTACSWYHVCAY